MSPTGFTGIKKLAREAEAQQAAFQQTRPLVLWFALKPDENALIRFLEEDDQVHYALMHEVPVPNRHWGEFVPCLDQDDEDIPCPGCEADIPRKYKGYINVIWYDAPVYSRDENGRLMKDAVGQKIINSRSTQVAVWTSGINLFRQLASKNDRYKGLCSRRFEVQRFGQRFATRYTVEPQDVDGGPQPFTEEEKALAESKPDLNAYVVPGSYEDFQVRLLQGGNDGFERPAESPNPFMRQS